MTHPAQFSSQCLLHSTDKLSDIDKLMTELVNEDMNCTMSPALYGLKADAKGILRAAKVVDTANATLAAAAAAAQKKSKPAFSSTPALSGMSAAPLVPALGQPQGLRGQPIPGFGRFRPGYGGSGYSQGLPRGYPGSRVQGTPQHPLWSRTHFDVLNNVRNINYMHST